MSVIAIGFHCSILFAQSLVPRFDKKVSPIPLDGNRWNDSLLREHFVPLHVQYSPADVMSIPRTTY